MTTAIVRFWRPEEGWGVVDSPQTPGGCFVHFSHIRMDGYRSLTAGQQVTLEWEVPHGRTYEGWPYIAVQVQPGRPTSGAETGQPAR